MSRIPDCREDEYYNQKYLLGRDRDFVDGLDYTSECADNYFDNMDVYYDEFDIQGEDVNLVKFLENHPAILECLRQTQKHWIEMERNEMITSMLDNMDEDVYDKHKAAVDGGEAKPYTPFTFDPYMTAFVPEQAAATAEQTAETEV